MTNLPKKISILGQTFKIETVENMKDTDGSELLGLMTGHQRSIKLSSNLTDANRDEVLLHEIIHAVLYISGVSNLLKDNIEESIVVALEHGLNGIYKLK